MVQIIESPDIFGRIGRAFGEGAAGQIERGMLSKEVRNVPGFPKAGADILSAPGGKETLPFIMPYLQSQAFIDQGKSGVSNPSGSIPELKISPSSSQMAKDERISQIAPNLSQQPVSNKTGSTVPSSLLSSEQDIAAANQKRLQPHTSRQRDELARELIQTGQVIDRGEAQKMADAQLNQNREAQTKMLGDAQGKISANMALDLQKEGLGGYKDVAGEIQRKLLQHADTQILQGANPADVQNEVSDIIRELGKTATQTKKTGSLGNLNQKKSEKISALKNQKKEYEKYGFGEVFDDMAQAALGISPMQLALELHPVQNEKFKKDVMASKGKFFNRDLPEASINRMVESIHPEDNILSMAGYLRDRHLDVGGFLDRARQKKDLTPEQIRQLNKPASNSLMGDILFRTF